MNYRSHNDNFMAFVKSIKILKMQKDVAITMEKKNIAHFPDSNIYRNVFKESIKLIRPNKLYLKKLH